MIRRWVVGLVEPEVKAWIKDAIRRAAPKKSASDADDPIISQIADLTKRQAKLEKRLSMAMGAIQAATTQLVDLRKSANQAAQAQQMATSATAMTESVADGLSAVEDQLAALMEKLGDN